MYLFFFVKTFCKNVGHIIDGRYIKTIGKGLKMGKTRPNIISMAECKRGREKSRNTF